MASPGFFQGMGVRQCHAGPGEGIVVVWLYMVAVAIYVAFDQSELRVKPFSALIGQKYHK